MGTTYNNCSIESTYRQLPDWRCYCGLVSSWNRLDTESCPRLFPVAAHFEVKQKKTHMFISRIALPFEYVAIAGTAFLRLPAPAWWSARQAAATSGRRHDLLAPLRRANGTASRRVHRAYRSWKIIWDLQRTITNRAVEIGSDVVC